MKNRIVFFLTIFAVATALTSCEQFLEEELTTAVTADNFYVRPEGYEAGIKACYHNLDDFWGSERGGTMTVFGTDAYTNGADGSHKGFNFYDTRLGPDASYVRDLWREMYRAINQCNAMVDRAGDVNGLDQDLINTRVGEARFLRALYYFVLVQQYGDVHLTLEETMGVELEANRTDRLQVYEQAIIPDLEYAIANLPDEWGNSDYGRATKPAAEFLLAKVVLTRGWLTGSNSDYARAQSLMEGVINNYNFALLDDWGAIWDQSNQLHSEVVWAVQNTQDLVINGSGNRFHLYFLMEYDVREGMTRDTENGRPWKRFRPTPWLENLWNDDQSVTQPLGTRADVRYEKGFKHVWLVNNPSTAPNGLQLGDTAFFLPAHFVSEEFENSKPYNIWTPDEYTEKIFPSLNKFIDPLRDNRQRTQGSRDFMVMRLADAYLIAAEAALLQGDVQTATDYVNVIRLRAAREGREAEMTVTADQVDIDYILDERARELVGEMHRWFDLTRTGKLVERTRKYNENAAQFIQDFHVVRPIPREQIDAVPGYPQNPGYPE